MTALKDLQGDEHFVEAVKHCAEVAYEKAMAQSEVHGEPLPVDKKTFMWGFWLGASYQKLDRLHAPDTE